MQGNRLIKNQNMPDRESAVQLLFEQYYPSLLFFAMRYVGDQGSAKDIVQEVFLRLFESKPEFDSVSDLKAYLYQSVRNRCLNYLRHEAVRRRHFEQALAVHESEQSYLNRMLEEEVYNLLIREIELMPPQCRKVFELVLEGRSNPEIADILDITVETVKSHKKTGKKLLYQRLKGLVSNDVMSFLLGFIV